MTRSSRTNIDGIKMAPSFLPGKSNFHCFDTLMSAMGKLKGAAFALLWAFTVGLVLIWDQNIFSILASALGVTATLLNLFSLRWWRTVAALASALFVINWALAFVLLDTGGSPFETYTSVIGEAMQSRAVLDGLLVSSYEVVLPVVHFVVSLVLITALLRRRVGK